MAATDGTPAPVVLTTERLELRPFSPDAIDALLRHDAATLAARAGARFPEPLRPPAMMDVVLPTMRDRVRAEPAEGPWWAWLIILLGAREVAGVSGFAGPPDDEGAVMMGYSVYPEHEGRGYASEAARALADWALQQPGVQVVRASVPSSRESAQRVAERAGLRRVGRQADEQWGEATVYEARRAGARSE